MAIAPSSSLASSPWPSTLWSFQPRGVTEVISAETRSTSGNGVVLLQRRPCGPRVGGHRDVLGLEILLGCGARTVESDAVEVSER